MYRACDHVLVRSYIEARINCLISFSGQGFLKVFAVHDLWPDKRAATIVRHSKIMIIQAAAKLLLPEKLLLSIFHK